MKIRLWILILVFIPLLLFTEDKSEPYTIGETSATSLSENSSLNQSSNLPQEVDFDSPVAKGILVIGLLGLIFLAIYNWQKSSKSNG